MRWEGVRSAGRENIGWQAGDAVEVFQVVIPCTVGCPEPQPARPALKHPDAPSRLYAESDTARLSKLVVFLPGSSASAVIDA